MDIKISDPEYPTLYEVMYMFEEKDRWLPQFIFNNMNIEGSRALLRMYNRVRN